MFLIYLFAGFEQNTHTQKALSHKISKQIENFQINKVQQNRQIANYTVRLDSKRHGNKLHMIAALKVQKKKYPK